MIQGISILDELQIRPRCPVGLMLLGELYADAGRIEEGNENLKKAEGMFKEMEMDFWLARPQGVLAGL